MSQEQPPLYQVYNNTIDMLYARGYIIPPSARKTEQEYASQFCTEDYVHRDRLALQCTMRDNRSKSLRVIFFCLPTDKTLGIAPLRSIMGSLGEDRTCVLIILPHGNELTAASRKLIKEMNYEKNVHVQCMMESELSINVSRVGRNRELAFRVLPSGSHELARFKKRFTGLASRGDKTYGVINVDDPLARFFALQRGDVLAGRGTSPTAGRYTTYKVCGEVY